MFLLFIFLLLKTQNGHCHDCSWLIVKCQLSFLLSGKSDALLGLGFKKREEAAKHFSQVFHVFTQVFQNSPSQREFITTAVNIISELKLKGIVTKQIFYQEKFSSYLPVCPFTAEVVARGRATQ